GARATAQGGLRGDVRSEDLPLILEMVAAIRPGVFGDDERTTELRQRYLSLCLEGLRQNAEPLTGAPPTDAELGRRWTRRAPRARRSRPRLGGRGRRASPRVADHADNRTAVARSRGSHEFRRG